MPRKKSTRTKSKGKSKKANAVPLTDVSDEQRDKYRHAFKRIDEDEDGSIDVHELHFHMRSKGLKVTINQVYALLGEGDLNDDQELSFDEFASIMENARSFRTSKAWVTAYDKFLQKEQPRKRGGKSQNSNHLSREMSISFAERSEILREALRQPWSVVDANTPKVSECCSSGVARATEMDSSILVLDLIYDVWPRYKGQIWLFVILAFFTFGVTLLFCLVVWGVYSAEARRIADYMYFLNQSDVDPRTANIRDYLSDDMVQRRLQEREHAETRALQVAQIYRAEQNHSQVMRAVRGSVW
jgi:hypothetical protein